MSSSFYSHLDSQLKKSLLSLVTLAPLHIVSIEYTVMREKGQDPLLQIEILLCETEQKDLLTQPGEKKEKLQQ